MMVAQVAKLRRKAILESANVHRRCRLPEASLGWWMLGLRGRRALPASTSDKRADSTISREQARSREPEESVWGHLEKCEKSRERWGTTTSKRASRRQTRWQPAPAAREGQQGNVARAPDHGIRRIRKGKIAENPLAGMRKNRTTKAKRLVSQPEMDLAVAVGRRLGGARLIVALALKTAWLCVRRSVEVRGIMRDGIRAEGLAWRDGKDATKPEVLIEWSDELRETVNEALQAKRSKVAGTMYLFGNQRGQRYTKGGWKAMLDDLMRECVIEAEKRKIPFKRFNLQDCRPKGVTDKLEKGHGDVLEATGHVDRKMVERHYDRREHKRATPAA
jgi:hypothetical protein